jgi:hypothetical protein
MDNDADFYKFGIKFGEKIAFFRRKKLTQTGGFRYNVIVNRRKADKKKTDRLRCRTWFENLCKNIILEGEL